MNECISIEISLEINKWTNERIPFYWGIPRNQQMNKWTNEWRNEEMTERKGWIKQMKKK